MGGKKTGKISPELLMRYCEGKCSAQELREVSVAAALTPEIWSTINDMKQAISLAEDLKEMEKLDLNAGYDRIMKNIKGRRREQFRRNMMRAAAVLFIPTLVGAAFLLRAYNGLLTQDSGYAEITPPGKAVISCQLPDKSTVWLNGGSTLKYPLRFKSNKREVFLDGEAYFEVTADRRNPFFVNTPCGLNVYVYGTSFNVNAYDELGFVETVLERGVVNIAIPDSETVIELEPGERLYYDKVTTRLDKAQVNIYEKTAWKDGKIIFRNTPIEDMLARLASHFNVDIEFRNLSGRDAFYHASFQHETLPQILDYLSTTADIVWRIAEPSQKIGDSITRQRITVELR